MNFPLTLAILDILFIVYVSFFDHKYANAIRLLLKDGDSNEWFTTLAWFTLVMFLIPVINVVWLVLLIIGAILWFLYTKSMWNKGE